MPKFYPKSQIKTGFYTNGEEYMLGETKTPYTGKYYKLSNGKIFSGDNYTDPNSKELVKIEQDQDADNPLNYFIDPPPTSDGEYIPFTPKSYVSNVSYLSSDTLKYINLTSQNPTPKLLPKYDPVFPTTEDYLKGEFLRFFCKKNNEPIYIEISLDYYLKLVNQDSTVLFSLYTPIQLTWTLTGILSEVYNTNRNMVKLAEKENKCVGFTEYFQRKFSKYFLEV